MPRHRYTVPPQVERSSDLSSIGPELTADVLTEGQVVVLRKEGRQEYVTVNVDLILPGYVMFYATRTATCFVGQRRDGGLIFDDTGTQIHIFGLKTPEGNDAR